MRSCFPRFGANVILCSPEGYELGGENDRNPQWMIDRNTERRKQACTEGGGSITLTRDPKEAGKRGLCLYRLLLL